MKNLHVVFEDEDYKILKESKGEETWRSFLLSLVREREAEQEDD